MRTTQRDGQGTITFSSLIIDAASGGGVAQPGAIPYVFTRTATGTYSINFDPAITPTQALVSGRNVPVVRASGISPGVINVAVESPAGTLSNNGVFGWQATALDGRR